MSNRKNRLQAYRTRFALVVVGLALGFAARSISNLFFSETPEPHFKPMPPAAASQAADAESDDGD